VGWKVGGGGARQTSIREAETQRRKRYRDFTLTKTFVEESWRLDGERREISRSTILKATKQKKKTKQDKREEKYVLQELL
jgi:hypothetical protein